MEAILTYFPAVGTLVIVVPGCLYFEKRQGERSDEDDTDGMLDHFLRGHACVSKRGGEQAKERATTMTGFSW